MFTHLASCHITCQFCHLAVISLVVQYAQIKECIQTLLAERKQTFFKEVAHQSFAFISSIFIFSGEVSQESFVCTFSTFWGKSRTKTSVSQLQVSIFEGGLARKLTCPAWHRGCVILVFFCSWKLINLIGVAASRLCQWFGTSFFQFWRWWFFFRISFSKWPSSGCECSTMADDDLGLRCSLASSISLSVNLSGDVLRQNTWSFRCAATWWRVIALHSARYQAVVMLCQPAFPRRNGRCQLSTDHVSGDFSLEAPVSVSIG